MQDESEVLRPPETAQFLGITLRHLYNIAERDPNFPRKIIFSKRCVGYRRKSLVEYLRAKEKEV